MKCNKLKKVMVAGLSITLCMGGAIVSNVPVINNLAKPVYADTIKDSAFSATGVINSDVSMRPGPGTSYKRLDALKKSTKVEIVAKSSNNWYKIKYKDGYAYVYNTYVTLDKNDNKEVAYTATGTTTTNLTVRKSASTSSTKLGTLKKGTKVNIVAKTSSWYKIKYKDRYAYVSSKYVTINSPESPEKPDVKEVQGVINHDVYVREAGSPTAKKIGVLTKGTKVNLLEKTKNGWYKINYKGKTGYFYGQYVDVTTLQETNY